LPDIYEEVFRTGFERHLESAKECFEHLLENEVDSFSEYLETKTVSEFFGGR
jgi:hypothetical protein